MAKSLTARLGLQRWSADSDTQQRSEFDNDNAQLESLVAIARQGLAVARGSATTWVRSLFYSSDTKAIDYADGTVWRSLMQGRAGCVVDGGEVIATTDSGSRITVALPSSMAAALSCVVTPKYSGGVNPFVMTVSIADGDGIRTFWVHDISGNPIVNTTIRFSWVLIGTAA